jgi:LuxR family transcriptional regulator, maltose regulon positive regulatory protein
MTGNGQLNFSEYQIVKLIAMGKSNKEIASELKYSPGTIRQYLSKIFQKTGAKNRTQLALMLRDGELQFTGKN